MDYAEAKGLIDRFNAKVVWDDEERVIMVRYSNDDLYEYIYVEDARSFKARLDLLRKYRLRGISVWRLGHEDPEVWRVLAQERRRMLCLPFLTEASGGLLLKAISLRL